MFLVTSSQMKELDSYAIEKLKIPSLVLMDHAGKGVARQILEKFPHPEKHRITVLCGSGNNGGDGFVAARFLNGRGFDVKVISISIPEKGDGKINYEILKKYPVPVVHLKTIQDLNSMLDDLRKSTIIIDAIFGTGLNSEIKGVPRSLIEACNEIDCYKVAVDIPSGINADNGQVMGTAFQADITVTFGLPKIGLALYPGASCAGDVKVVDISIPEWAYQKNYAQIIDPAMVKSCLPLRKADSHKGTFGHVLIIAGSSGKAGASLLAGISSLKCGAGLCTIGTENAAQAHIEGKFPELMIEGFFNGSSSKITADYEHLDSLLSGKTVVVVGCGIGTRKGTRDLIEYIIGQSGCPVVLDADAVNVFEKDIKTLSKFAKNRELIVTPHPGEMARLTDIPAKIIQKDRVKTACETAASNGFHLILKGARTVVASKQGSVFINPTGNPGMATAGSGDVLSGMIGGIICASGQPVLNSCAASVYIHGLSGDMACSEKGETSLTAMDIVDYIPVAVKKINEF
jgi:NAD(P)H-hydrate epimerase